jgi:DNA-directed RNA polymerase subunit omega
MKTTIIENKYRKVLAVAQRARQLKNGARPLIYLPGVRATRVALEEVERGLISYDSGNEQRKELLTGFTG